MDLDEIYKLDEFDTYILENKIGVGRISEKDKFLAAKQILLGISLLYVFTVIAYLINPDDCEKLVDICITIFPPLATLILASYFRDKGS